MRGINWSFHFSNTGKLLENGVRVNHPKLCSGVFANSAKHPSNFAKQMLIPNDPQPNGPHLGRIYFPNLALVKTLIYQYFILKGPLNVYNIDLAMP